MTAPIFDLGPFARHLDADETFSNTKLVLAHITDFPGKNIRQIAEYLGMEELEVRNAVARLAEAGKVRPMPKNDSDRRKRWEVGYDESYAPRTGSVMKPKQSTVTSWEQHSARDPLVAALFGQPKTKTESDKP